MMYLNSILLYTLARVSLSADDAKVATKAIDIHSKESEDEDVTSESDSDISSASESSHDDAEDPVATDPTETANDTVST